MSHVPWERGLVRKGQSGQLSSHVCYRDDCTASPFITMDNHLLWRWRWHWRDDNFISRPCDEPNPEVPLAAGRQDHFPSCPLVAIWWYCFNFVPQVIKEVTWLSSWKSLAVDERDISDFWVKHLRLWDELSPGHSLAWLAHPTCWRAGLSKLQVDEVKRLW